MRGLVIIAVALVVLGVPRERALSQTVANRSDILIRYRPAACEDSRARRSSRPADDTGPASESSRPAADDTEPAPEPSSQAADDIGLDPEEPPISWSSWSIEGEALSAGQNQQLTAFLKPVMARHPNLDRQARCTIQTFLAQDLGYQLTGIRVESFSRAGKLVVLEIEPLTLVRRIAVKVTDQKPYDALRLDTVFEAEIVRRMRLRAGMALAYTSENRTDQLRLEAERIKQYLQSEGYFDAKAMIVAKGDGANAVTLTVYVTKGTPYTTGDITIEGNRTVSTEEIETLFRQGQFCFFNQCLLEQFRQQALNENRLKVVELYKTRGFPAVRVTTDFDPRRGYNFNRQTQQVDFTVTVNERRRISVVFEGNDESRGFSEEVLKPLLTFEEVGSYDEVEVSASADAIRRYYQSRGYFEARVAHESVDFDIYLRIIFSITPGPLLPVKEVQFTGNKAITSDQIRASLQTQPFRPAPILSTDGYVTAEAIQGDINRIVELYRQNGYREAEVEARVSRSGQVIGNAAVVAALVTGNAGPRPEEGLCPNNQAHCLYVRFVIDEGVQTVIDDVSVRFRGSGTGEPEAIAAQAGIASGDAYVEERLREGQRRIERYFFENAYPRASVKRCEYPGSKPGRIRVVYDLDQREQVRFGKVMIRGNFKTNEWLILDELGFEEGDRLTFNQAEVGQRNLRASGLFNSVQVNFLDLEDGSQQDVNVVVDVQERHDYWFGLEFAVGVSSDDGGFIEGAILNPNILGTGLSAALRGQSSLSLVEIGSAADSTDDGLVALPLPNCSRKCSIEGQLVVPRWAVRKLSELATGGWLAISPRLETSAFLRQEQTERFGELNTAGISAAVTTVGRSGFFSGWLLSLGYDYRLRTREEDLVRNIGSNRDVDAASVTTATGAVGPTLIIDKRKDASGRANPLTPEAGFKLEFRASYASNFLLGEDEFVKLGTSGQHFWKLSDRLLLTNGIRYDHGIPLREPVLPEVERFFAGGDSTVRGFEEDRLATEIIESPLPGLGPITRIRVLPAGGNVRFIHNLDLQIRIWQLLGVPVASALFLDTGLVAASLEDFAVSDLRHALGVALFRWVAPVGSLSIEYAIPLDPKLGDNPRGRLHFNFGLQF